METQLADIRNQKVGFVFQSFDLLPYASAYENIELPLIFAGVPTPKRKQRVAMACSMVNNPRIIMADEPTGNLDSQSGQDIMELFQNLWHTGNTIVMITHDASVLQYCDRVIYLMDGRLVDQPEPEFSQITN